MQDEYEDFAGEEEESDNDEEEFEDDDDDQKVIKKTEKGQKDKSKEDKGIWEDIYGRTRDAAGNVVKATTATKYVPPALRAQAEAAAGKGAADAIVIAKLSKQVRIKIINFLVKCLQQNRKFNQSPTGVECKMSSFF